MIGRQPRPEVGDALGRLSKPGAGKAAAHETGGAPLRQPLLSCDGDRFLGVPQRRAVLPPEQMDDSAPVKRKGEHVRVRL